MNFFLYPFYHLPIVSFFLISLLHLFFESKFFMTEKSLFPHFISLLLFSCFLSFFYLSSCFVKRIWWAGGQNTSSREIIEGSGGKWPPRSEKKGPLLFFFVWAWPKVWVDGPESKKENAPADHFSARLGSNSVFLVTEWLVCDTDSPRDIRQWMLSIISLWFSFSLSSFTLFMFTLFPQHVAKRYCKDWAAWGGEAAPRGPNGLCRRSMEDRARKNEERQLNDLEEETRKVADRVTAALVIWERAHEWLLYKAQDNIQQGLGEEPVQRY